MDTLKKLYIDAGISEKVYDFCDDIQKSLKERFEQIDAVAEYNQTKVIRAMQKNRVSAACFETSTGYGYDDLGGETLEAVYADVFEAESALVRPQLMSGTHALTVALFGNLRPGDELLSPVGKPYDTLEGVIGIRTEVGNLAEEMEDVLFDYHLAQSLVNQSGDSADFRIRVYAESVFKKHEVTEEQFNNSLRYYHRHTTELHDIYKNIEKRMNFLVGDYSETRYTSEGDTANIWQGPERYLMSAALRNYITFSQPTDTLLEEGDKLELNFSTGWIYKEGQRQGVAVLYVQYEGDSVATSTQQFSSSGPQQVVLRIGAKKKIEGIRGMIYQHTTWTSEPKLLVISDISLIRYHSSTPKTQKEDFKAQSDSIKMRREHITDSVRNTDKRTRQPFREVTPQRATQKQFHLGNH